MSTIDDKARRLINTDKCLYLMEHRSDGTGQRLFALDDCGDTLGEPRVDVRIATSRNAYNTLLMEVPLALAAYEWLGRWLATQGAIVPTRR